MKMQMALLLAVSAALPVAAEEEAAPAPPAHPPAAGQPAEPAPPPGPLNGKELEELLGRLAALQGGTCGFWARFENQKESALVEEIVKSRGVLAVLKPETFYREVGGDEPSVTFLDGEALLIYFPKERKAERYRVKGEKGKEDMDALLAGFSFDLAKLKQRFKVAAEREKDGLIRIDLEPLKEDDAILKYVTKISVWTDGKCPWPLALETHNPDGDVSRDVYSDIEVYAKDKELPEKAKAILAYKPPPRTRIIEPAGR